LLVTRPLSISEDSQAYAYGYHGITALMPPFVRQDILQGLTIRSELTYGGGPWKSRMRNV
jgi:hypothetical protein